MNNRIFLLTVSLAASGVLGCARNPAPAGPGGLPADYRRGQYSVFTGTGAPSTLDDVVRAMGAHQVVLVGESHDDPTGHYLELELFRRAARAYGGSGQREVALSLEFFERDVQPMLDQYLAGSTDESVFLAGSRPWPRYAADYRPMIEFAKQERLPVIAANAPRRYITMVTRQGRTALDTLDAPARQLLAPLPYGKASPAYRDKWIATISEVMKQEGMKCGVRVDSAAAPPGTHQNMSNQLDSQVLWDATMAHSIAQFIGRRPQSLVLHMVGGFHVERGTGIPEQLQAYSPGVRTMIIVLRPVDKVDVFQSAPRGSWGDFVIQTEKARTLESIDCREFLSKRNAGSR